MVRVRATDDLLLDTARVLWPGGAAAQVTRRSRPSRPSARTSDWLALPRMGAPRWLLPATAPATVAALAGPRAPWTRRIALEALVGAHRGAVVRGLPVRRLRVTETGDSVVAAVRAVLGADVDVAIRLGSWQHARTVVLRAFSPDGATLAFGKLGIDLAGRDAVRAETDALAHVAALGLRRVVHSRVLHRETWRGTELVLVSPLLGSGTASDAGPPLGAMLELSGSTGARTAALGDSAWAVRTGERVDLVGDTTLRAELAAHLDRLDRAAGPAPMALGPSHGDWTAWNMARDGSRVLLWDWEHFGLDVPVGFDPVHFLAQQLRVSTGTGPSAEAAWLDLAHACLARDLAMPVTTRDVVLAAYLLDVNLRFVLDRQGTPLATARREGWGLPLLRRLVAAQPPTSA